MIIKRGDIFISDLPFVAGSMQCGRRPIIVVSNNKANDHSKTITVVPCTLSDTKAKLPTHVEVDENCDTHTLKGMALAECITTIDKSLLIRKIGCCSPKEMIRINIAILIQVGIDIFEMIGDCTKEMFRCVRGN